ncbi:hypothetical protein O181_037833 [Austropuccinia psidii MF-1]|uniref:Uncharacterized protein n=1 Tax=Austropuccinia psidii MF-1 TaxID=1389203 RepID=A0A9Q3DC77_9BASI|nr:hypothetical protein [Austropuccinia psidii MF-1]
MESQQAVQTPGGEDNMDNGKSSHYSSYRRKIESDRAYSDSFRLTRSKQTRLPSSFAPFRQQQISDQESPLFTIPGSFQEKTRTKREKKTSFSHRQRVRPNDPEAIELRERSTQESEVVVNTSRISSPSNRNITPTHNENNLTPESSLKSDQLWLQMSRFAVQTQEKLYELQRRNVRLQELPTVQQEKIKAIQYSCAKLRKAS